MSNNTAVRDGFETQRKAGINVDWLTWQIAWHDAAFTLCDNVSSPAADESAKPIAQIEYRYDGGTEWCDLGPAEPMRTDFKGVYRLKVGVFPVDLAAVASKEAVTLSDSVPERDIWTTANIYLSRGTRGGSPCHFGNHTQLYAFARSIIRAGLDAAWLDAQRDASKAEPTS